MNKLLISVCVVFFALCAPFTLASDTGDSVKAVESQVERLRIAMIEADAAELKKLTRTDLSYGHSGGHVENQAAFIEKLVSGNSDFVSIELKDQTVNVFDDVAIVRHMLVATTNDRGTPGEVSIGVMLVWTKSAGEWKLLARQAFKPH